ncbi:protein BIG GRAIN 1-like B [Mangifera indica]|uniref:protein BIG GRAIN 1-like B n=1 Tax=Mangifera indica TaxID=29780 RepID=UPI001CFABD12|nr:protein BIG GRAIN 1-like B [Mangifera indica]
MDVWEKYSLREDHHLRHQSRNRRENNNNPSFSSTLLDAIYRSIDESNGKGDDDDREVIFYRESMRKKKHGHGVQEDDQMARMQRACMIERWMEKKVSCEKVIVRRNSLADFETKHHFDNSVLLNSSSSSSESSCGGGFSSSESDSFYGAKSRSKSSSCYSIQKPKPVRTSISSSRPEKDCVSSQKETAGAPKHEGGSGKMKLSKALKIYSDLKKVKQPISPGGRLANFLNSIFTAGNAKKGKIINSSQPESACSSASSFSRSCLSKTPSSRGQLSNGTKRSVRFFPVSVIVGEDCRPCGHKDLYENTNKNEEVHYRIMNESQRVQEAARELLKNYHQKKELDNDLELDDGEEEEDDDDDASCASSDLFELDNLSAIGAIERYQEELPVYETTHLDTNRAIANGLIL